VIEDFGDGHETSWSIARLSDGKVPDLTALAQMGKKLPQTFPGRRCVNLAEAPPFAGRLFHPI
jgi:hypothetical protein